VDFEQDRVRIARKDANHDLNQWEPKDHEGRVIPCPSQVIQLMADLQSESTEGCRYVFVPPWRWDHIRLARAAGTWDDEQKMLNNLNRRLATLRRRAGISKLTFHDLRRSCITNWARTLPTHLVQKLAGHSDIKTTQHYYLAVRQADLEEARRVQTGILQEKVTDQQMTN
jgi:integrase